MSLLLDWLVREGHWLFNWWLWITLAGVAALPLCLRLLGGLPDRGYTLARAIGLLLVSFVFWLLASWGLLDNSSGSISFAWLLVLIGALALYAQAGHRQELRRWWQENRALVIVSELLFITLFFAWALYRAHQNNIIGTEKPMELAFISATQRSASFPPADPWMAGYAISYYYMGYVMSSSLSLLSGVSSTIAFNLTIAAQFSLTGLGAFGVVYNLARSRAFERAGGQARRSVALAAGLLGMALMVLLGNFQLPLIEVPYVSRAASETYLDYWGMPERSNFPVNSETGASTYQQKPEAQLDLRDLGKEGWWWWFKASRILADYDLNGNLAGVQPISEFPAFSFLLADVHPHVLALPFVVAVIGLMLNLLLLRRGPRRAEILLYGIALGGLVFLNTWDGPIYLLGFAGVEALRRLMTNERGRLVVGDWLGSLRFAAVLVLVAAIAYLPYLIGLRSQAGGILPNLAQPTYLPRFFIMFGPFIIMLALYLLVELWRGKQARRLNWRLGLTVSLVILLASLGLMTLLGFLQALGNPNLPISGYSPASSGSAELIGLLVQRRLENSATTILLLLGISVVLARLFPSARQARSSGAVAIQWISYPKATGFALLLIGLGLSLTLLPEFFYLKDNFGVRMNTIFKFYYQAWVMWSIAAAYAVYSVLGERALPRPQALLRLAFGLIVALCVAAGTVYTLAGVYHRALVETGRLRDYAPPADWQDPQRHVAAGMTVEAGTALFSRIALDSASEADIMRANEAAYVTFAGETIVLQSQKPLTLDGADGLLHPDDQKAIECLNALVGRGESAVVAEAVGPAYDINYGRVGTLTGIPVLLGWENHERQWRGATYNAIAGGRRENLKTLYTSTKIEAAREIINRYDITYILYGSSERRQYDSLGEEKFLNHLRLVCEAGRARIFYTGHTP